MTASIVRNVGEGERMWFLGGGIHTWKAQAEETGNSMIVFEDELERGKVTPMHLHADVDEAAASPPGGTGMSCRCVSAGPARTAVGR